MDYQYNLEIPIPLKTEESDGLRLLSSEVARGRREAADYIYKILGEQKGMIGFTVEETVFPWEQVMFQYSKENGMRPHDILRINIQIAPINIEHVAYKPQAPTYDLRAVLRLEWDRLRYRIKKLIRIGRP